MSISNLIFKLCGEWSTPRLGVHNGRPCPFLLKCNFLHARQGEVPSEFPSELKELYRVFESIELFVDVDFGQWGLSIFSTKIVINKTNKFRNERPVDSRKGDWVIGEFKGDLDSLIFNESEGVVLIALPLDDRDDWDIVGGSLSEFIESYAKNHGGKFWE